MNPLDETLSIVPSANENTLEKRELWWLMGMLALGTGFVIVYNARITIGTGLPVSQGAQYAQYALIVALVLGSPFGVHLSHRVGLPISPPLKRYLAGQRVPEAWLIQFGLGFVLGLPVLVLILTPHAL